MNEGQNRATNEVPPYEARFETTKVILKLLNEALESDPIGISAIFNTRSRTTEELMNHPTIEVGIPFEGGYRVSPMGIINGILRTLNGTLDESIGASTNPKTFLITEFLAMETRG